MESQAARYQPAETPVEPPARRDRPLHAVPDVAYRFADLDEAVADNTELFYKTGNLSRDGTIQVLAYRKALSEVELLPKERAIYTDWQSHDIESPEHVATQALVARCAGHRALSTEAIADLRQTGDPAVHAMDRFNAEQHRQLPELDVDVRLQAKAQLGHLRVIAGIHGQPIKPRPKGQKVTAEEYRQRLGLSGSSEVSA